MISKYPEGFKFDPSNEKLLTKEEWDLGNKNKELEKKIALLTKQNDKLYLENYEFKWLKKNDTFNLDETKGELFDVKYQNNL